MCTGTASGGDSLPIGTSWLIALGLTLVSIALLLGLLYIYVGNYRSLRSPFSVGLIVFAALCLLKNLAAMCFYGAMNDSNLGASVAIPMLVLNAAELVGFATLFFVSWR